MCWFLGAWLSRWRCSFRCRRGPRFSIRAPLMLVFGAEAGTPVLSEVTEVWRRSPNWYGTALPIECAGRKPWGFRVRSASVASSTDGPGPVQVSGGFVLPVTGSGTRPPKGALRLSANLAWGGLGPAVGRSSPYLGAQAPEGVESLFQGVASAAPYFVRRRRGDSNSTRRSLGVRSASPRRCFATVPGLGVGSGHHSDG